MKKKQRVNDIEKAHLGGEITTDQYNELTDMEKNITRTNKFKYAALALLLATVGFFVVLSSM